MAGMKAISDKISSLKIIRPLLVVASFVVLFLAFLHLKVSLDIERNYRPHIFDASYDLPGPNVLRAATLNFRSAAADIVWVQGVQFVAKSVVARRTADDVTYFARTLIDLDPYFYKVYAWHSAARMLAAGYPSPEDIEAANDVIEVGMEYFPHDWRLPYEATANYIGFNRGVDKETRIRQLERGIHFADAAAPLPDTPDMMFLLAMRFRERLAQLRASSDETANTPSDTSEASREMLTRLYLLADSAAVRKSLLQRMRRTGGTEELARTLRRYDRQQAQWYEHSNLSYLPLELFSNVAETPSGTSATVNMVTP